MKYFIPILLLFIIGCKQNQNPTNTVIAEDDSIVVKPDDNLKSISEIPVPENYERIKYADGSFENWLRKIPLKKDKRVFLYNGTLKKNQAAQFAVVDIPTGNKDLQQCADVVMRLRAEYLFLNKQPMSFIDYSGKSYKWNGSGDRNSFENYLQNVFGWCGSASLEKQLNKVADFSTIKAGDVLIHGGFPGHAVMVVDIAKNQKGEKIYLLVQGYQPAQDIHILNNPMSKELNPWYAIDTSNTIYTPEWWFSKQELRTW